MLSSIAYESCTCDVLIIYNLPGSILSTSGDKTIKIFNIITGECDITFKGHSDYVRTAIELIDTRIISGSDDKSIRIWDSKTGELDLKIENT